MEEVPVRAAYKIVSRGKCAPVSPVARTSHSHMKLYGEKVDATVMLTDWVERNKT